MTKPAFLAALAALLVFGAASASSAAGPLRAEIDRLIADRAQGPLAPVSDDAEFLRRIYLDLAGRIPTADEAKAFLADDAPKKRAALIDRLLDGPDYPRRMQELFNIMLMERRGENASWQDYLERSFAANKPWDQMVREMLNPDTENADAHGANYFVTQRLEAYGQNPTDHPGLVRDVGRLFLGMDLQCCQCHDHLFVDDYKQDLFQGLFAFLGHTSIRSDLKFPAVGEKLVIKKTEFMSVFVQKPHETGPRIPGGEEVAIEVFGKGEEFRIPPDKTTRAPGIPRFSPMTILSQQLPAADNAPFARNIANRLWFVMLGRGLVHPLDLHHSDNPPSHPELLDLLTAELKAAKFDIKWMLRELALSETYQRSGRLPEAEDKVPPESFRMALERPVGAEQFMMSTLVATGELSRFAATAADPPAEAKAAAGSGDGADDEEEAEGPKKAPLPTTLAEVRKRFLAAMANPPREPEEEYTPTVRGALFVLNDEAVQSWLLPREGNLIERLAKIADPGEVADELYLSVLTRRPTAEERDEVAQYLTRRADRRERALAQLAWALLASTEFSTNH